MGFLDHDIRSISSGSSNSSSSRSSRSSCNSIVTHTHLAPLFLLYSSVALSALASWTTRYSRPACTASAAAASKGGCASRDNMRSAQSAKHLYKRAAASGVNRTCEYYPSCCEEENQVTHTNTQQEQHNARHDKNNTTTRQHTTRQEQHHKRPHEEPPPPPHFTTIESCCE